MAFAFADLALIAHGKDKKLYHYGSTVDAMSAIVAAGYFDAAVELLDVGDVLVVQDTNDAVAIIRVSAKTATTLTVSYTTGWQQQPKINDPAGGTTVDTEARTAIAAIIDALEAHGVTAAV